MLEEREMNNFPKNPEDILHNRSVKKIPDVVSDKDSENPELRQINNLIEKVLDIQHPERVKRQLAIEKQEEGDKSLFVLKKNQGATISRLGKQTKKARNIVPGYNLTLNKQRHTVISG